MTSWFQYLKVIKGNKLQRLTANSPEQTAHQEPNIEDNDTSEVDKVVKTIPENLNLSEAEKSVLQKGLNFIPIKPTTDEFPSKKDCEKFYRRLRLKAFFHDKDQDRSEQSIENQDQQNGETKEDLVFEQLNPKKSTWVPPPGKFSSLHHYIQRYRTEIDQLNFRKCITNHNLTQEGLNALKSL